MILAGFALSLFVMLILARFSLPLAMLTGAFFLAVFSLRPLEVLPAIARTLVDPGVLALTFAVGLIPLIGAGLRRGGWLEALVARLPGGKRTVFSVVPAIFGLLPIPGGALLSAPILERVGGGKSDERAAANVWFRHIFLFFYPMSAALITGAKLTGLDLWTLLPYQIPWAAFAALLGAIFILPPFSGPKNLDDPGPLSRTLFPWIVLLLAPGLDFAIKRVFHLPAPEVATLIALFGSFLLVVIGLRGRGIVSLFQEAQPWRFSLIIVGMFSYLGAFQGAGLPQILAALNLPPLGMVVGLGLLMGLATGRQQAAISVSIPIYLASRGGVNPWTFSVIYQAAYLGYLLSPLHPCLVVSAEYARTTVGAVWRRLALPSLLFFVAVVITGLFLL